jgi:triosephosphate isomerase
VAGNWKMHRTPAEGAALARELAELLRARSACEVAVCPPFTGIAAVVEALRDTGIHAGGQNLHAEPQGAFTGEVSGAMLRAAGCRFVIVGHSERRHGCGEDDATVARKLRAALRDGLTPIVCVGETLAERDGGQMADVLVRQVLGAYDGLDAATAKATVVAYEPVWAIGTGRVATPAQAREAHELLRAALDRVSGPGVGRQLAILYGGSVNADNAATLFADEEIDGALVGGASLQAPAFWKIVAAAGSGA